MFEGDGGLKARVLRGGLVYMAGARSVLGQQCETWTLSEALVDTPCTGISAGYVRVLYTGEPRGQSPCQGAASCVKVLHRVLRCCVAWLGVCVVHSFGHSAAVTADGEVFLWGSNRYDNGACFALFCWSGNSLVEAGAAPPWHDAL